MPKLFSSKQIVSILEKNSFLFVSQKGSHAKYENLSLKAVVIVPMAKREIPVGTLKSIIRQSGLSRTKF